MKKVFCILAIAFLSVTATNKTRKKKLTDRPIIGILAQQPSKAIQQSFPGFSSYISAAYVKAVESSGARVAPIFINQTKEYYRNITNSVNGVIFPGGNSWFDVPGGYAEAAEHIYQTAKELNDNGNHFPILGVGVGFQTMLYFDNNKKDMRYKCMVKNVSLPFEFKKGYRKSWLYKPAPRKLIRWLQRARVTFNDHQFCVSENFDNTKLTSKWKALTLSKDNENKKFLSSLESKQYPFVGIQFNPEKSPFDWTKTKNIPHSYRAVKVSRYFHDWLVHNSKLNNNKFSKDTEMDSLIYNYKPEFAGRKNLMYEQIYLFQ